MESSDDIDTTRYYNTLGVRKDATLEQIKSQYRKLASREQPELGGDPVLFQLIKDAFNVLKNPEKRRLYDMYGETLAPPAAPSYNQDFFGNNLFGQNYGSNPFGNLFSQPPPSDSYDQPQASTQNQNREASSAKSPPINVDIEISLEDSYKGKLERVSYQRKVTPGNFNPSTAQI